MGTDEHIPTGSSEPVTDAWRMQLSWPLRLLILLALAAQTGRLLQVESRSGDLPFLSANDRSRWCTIEALAKRGSYEIDHLIFDDEAKQKRSNWYTIDLVRHRGADGKLHYYSSKPTLLPTMYAGIYWVLSQLTGLTLLDQPFPMGRAVLFVVNLLPLALFWSLCLRWFQQRSDDPWSILLLGGMAVWGTYLSTFAITLNNHLPAALAVAASLWCLDRIAIVQDTRTRWFVLCGLATSFAAANELPALSWVLAAGAILLLVSAKKTLLAYVPALLPVAIAFFGTNYLAHGVWSPAYAHRDVGAKLFDFEAERYGQLTVAEVSKAMESHSIYSSDSCILRPARRKNTIEFFDQENQIQYALRVPDNQGTTVSVHEWDDWYDYPGSYWAGEKPGVDAGEADRAKYIFHCLLGHHGILSLTPFWLLSLLGVFAVLNGASSQNPLKNFPLLIGGAIAATTLVVLAFYFTRGLEDRNYGGVSSGLRWTFWLIPLWLWLANASLQLHPGKAARRVIELLLLVSVFSACYPWQNPWTSPWLMQFLEYWGLPV